MLHATEQIDLVRLACLCQDLLGFMAFGGREDRIGLWCNVMSRSGCSY